MNRRLAVPPNHGHETPELRIQQRASTGRGHPLAFVAFTLAIPSTQAADVIVTIKDNYAFVLQMMVIVGVMLGVLLLASAWIWMLRRQVAQRTVQLQAEILEREHAEKLRGIAE